MRILLLALALCAATGHAETKPQVGAEQSAGKAAGDRAQQLRQASERMRKESEKTDDEERKKKLREDADKALLQAMAYEKSQESMEDRGAALGIAAAIAALGVGAAAGVAAAAMSDRGDSDRSNYVAEPYRSPSTLSTHPEIVVLP